MPFGHVLDAPALRASGFAPCSPASPAPSPLAARGYGPVFRVCALRFAPCARHSSRFAASGFAPCSPASPAPSPLAARGYGPAYFRLRTGRAFGGPVFRVCALRFAPCARHSSRFAAFGSKLPGPSRPSASLITARCSGAADALWACPRRSSRFAASDVRKAHLQCSLFHWGLRTGLRFAGPVFRGFDGYGLFRALRAAFVRPFTQGRRLVVQLPAM